MSTKALARTTGIWFAVLIAFGFFCTSWSRDADAANLYRYRNAEGVLVIEYTIPPEYVAKGYEIVTPSGRVIETVPAQINESKTTGEQPREDPEELRRRKEAQSKEDTWLMTSYSSVEDIERAGQRKLEQIQREIDIVQTNKADTLEQLAKEKVRAADYQRSGQALPGNLNASLGSLYQQLRDADKLLLQRKTELDALQQLIEKQIQRFNELKGL